MNRLIATTVLSTLLFGLGGCTTTTVRTLEIYGEGAYIIGYSNDAALRKAFEDRLVADLAKLQMHALPSYPDFPSVEGPSPEDVIRKANELRLAGIVIVNPVRTDQAGPVTDPHRVTPEHRELREFYTYSKDALDTYDPDTEMFAEVNAYVIDGDGTRLIWSGVTWNFESDGAGSAISAVSALIAENLVKARDEFLAR